MSFVVVWEILIGLQLVGFDLSEEIVVGLQLVGLALSGGISARGCVNLFLAILKLLTLYLFLVTCVIGQFRQLFSELLLVSFSATPLVAQSRH